MRKRYALRRTGLRSLHYIAGGQFYAIGDSVIAGTRSR